MRKIRVLLKKLLPESIRRYLTGLFYGWHGNYSSWDEALKKSDGYNSDTIIQKVKESALKVKNGSVNYERDSVLFEDAEYNLPLLTGLMWIAAQNNGRLNIMDIGGSLGSSYFQHRVFLDSLSQLNWCIVEQPGFVKEGLESFKDGRLHFFMTVEDCLKSFEINVVLLSSVLQYLEKPYDLLIRLKAEKLKFIIIDRTPFIKGNDRITVQRVPPWIYKGSYPCWFFNERKFINNFMTDYKLVLKFSSLDKANIPSEFKGFILQKINS
jgi:putative methyltransferase (TIGR04325 family)